MARSSQKTPTGPEGMNIQMLGNMNGGMQNMLLGPSWGRPRERNNGVLPTKNTDFCSLPRIKDICIDDVVFGKDVDEIVQICSDMICVYFIHIYISYEACHLLIKKISRKLVVSIMYPEQLKEHVYREKDSLLQTILFFRFHVPFPDVVVSFY